MTSIKERGIAYVDNIRCEEDILQVEINIKAKRNQKITNPLPSLGADDLLRLLDPVFNHKLVQSKARSFGLEVSEIKGELYERLVQCAPRKQVNNVEGWIFANTVGYVRQIGKREVRLKLRSMEDSHVE